MNADVLDASQGRAAACDVLCIGESMAMVTPLAAAPLETAEVFGVHSGGAESNVAVYLAALGHRAAWASRLGADPLGRRVRRSITDMGVDTGLVEHVAGGRTGVYFKDPGPGGTVVHYYRDGSAAASMDRTFVARLPGTARHIHLSGVTPALSEACRDMVEQLLGPRVLGSASISLDVNYRVGLWDPATAAPVLLALAQRADIVFTGRDEAELLWGTATPADIRTLLGDVPTVVVKDAEHAATEFSVGSSWSVPALAVEVRDAVGAGDAFAAGWLAARLRGLGPVSRLRLGHLVAAGTLQSTSDFMPPPSAAEIDGWLALDDAGWRALRPTSATADQDR
jgi:2-dehydro-3-deoxygluconokinase